MSRSFARACLLVVLSFPGVALAQQPDAGSGPPPPTGELADAALDVGVSALVIQAGAGEGHALLAPRIVAMRQGRPTRTSLTLAASTCYVFAANAEESVTDVDLVVARGRTELVRDSGASRQATARHCTGEAEERVQLTITAFRGRGRVAFAAYEAPPEQPPAPETDQALVGLSALDRLAAVAARHTRHFSRVTPAAREQLDQRGAIERTIPLATGRCYRIFAVGDDSVGDLDLEIEAPGGGVLARDEVESRNVAVGVTRPFCPAQTGDHKLRIRLMRGRGAFAYQVFGSGEGATEARPEGTPQFLVGGRDQSFLGRTMRSLHERVATNAEPVSRAMLATLGTNAERTMGVRVEAGRCYSILGVGVPSARELDLIVNDEFGHESARDATQDAAPHVRFCPTVAGLHTVHLRMFNGYGRTMVQAFAE